MQPVSGDSTVSTVELEVLFSKLIWQLLLTAQ